MNIVKLSEIDDIDSVLSLDYQAIKDFFVLIKNSYSQDDILRAWRYNSGSFFAGIVDDEIIAMCGYRKIDRKTAELRKLRVDRKQRRKGYGTHMVRFIEEQVQSRGFSRIVFSTAALREGTLKFYETLGYTRTGEGMYEKLRVFHYEKVLVPVKVK
ncbi:MAG: GNAT family N-acetyltransferase [Spirochaetales bacterium]|nr:GNAT family N-acetyltransferase [Spirochaetales bacterium]